MKKGLLAISLLLIFTCFNLVGCNSNNDKDIVILYTTDVHCKLSENVGYSSLSAYKKKLAQDNYVTLIDAGDATSGDFIGAISKGEYLIDIMNELDYDFMVLGNHEFDYGMDILKERIDQFEGDVLSCNFEYIGHNENKFGDVKDYKIIKYGKKKVGFVGVTTPYSLTSSTPTYFMEDGETVYSFTANTTNEFYQCVQKNIDSCHKEKADYVILVTHLGYSDIYSPYTSADVIANTTGACAVLDGHAHLDLDCTYVKNKQGIDVPLCDAGYQMSSFGELRISTKGDISLQIANKDKEGMTNDPEIDAYIDVINQRVDELASQVLATIDMNLMITDEEGIRIVRNRETSVGNLIADAYRYFGESDIAFVNGGGIRANLLAGDVTYSEIMAVHPFGNNLCVIEVDGQEILDYLEFVYRKVQNEYKQDGRPLGEFGGFAHISGLKVHIDTSVETPIITDEAGNFVEITSGPRRVHDVEVLENGAYVPLDPSKTYSVSSHNYLLLSGGDGATMFMDNNVIRDNVMFDYEVVVNYITDVLEGQLLNRYQTLEGRITIE